ncbi:hypothetical protein DFH06DRAFT_1316252 [Mycena polygramma]|nr:hypothetical protein DFH06DRAFT_1316252 [Mycena polygramma]
MYVFNFAIAEPAIPFRASFTPAARLRRRKPWCGIFRTFDRRRPHGRNVAERGVASSSQNDHATTLCHFLLCHFLLSPYSAFPSCSCLRSRSRVLLVTPLRLVAPLRLVPTLRRLERDTWHGHVQWRRRWQRLPPFCPATQVSADFSFRPHTSCTELAASWLFCDHAVRGPPRCPLLLPLERSTLLVVCRLVHGGLQRTGDGDLPQRARVSNVDFRLSMEALGSCSFPPCWPSKSSSSDLRRPAPLYITQYYTSLPRPQDIVPPPAPAGASTAAPAGASTAAPASSRTAARSTRPNASVTAANLAAASANLANTAAATVLQWAPANVVPATPAHHCVGGRCDICHAQHLVVSQNAHGPNGPHTGPLPHRRTCTPPFCPDHPGIDVLTHSLEAGCMFYAAIPARNEAIYTSAQTAREQTEGVHNGVAKSAKTWDEAKGHWVLGCLRWHGNECRRERLQRADATGKSWAVLGTDIICGSRAAAFRIAQDRGFDDIRIRGHRDASVLRNWLENGSSDEEFSDDD